MIPVTDGNVLVHTIALVLRNLAIDGGLNPVPQSIIYIHQFLVVDGRIGRVQHRPDQLTRIIVLVRPGTVVGIHHCPQAAAIVGIEKAGKYLVIGCVVDQTRNPPGGIVFIGGGHPIPQCFPGKAADEIVFIPYNLDIRSIGKIGSPSCKIVVVVQPVSEMVQT